MKVSELNALIENLITNEVKTAIVESTMGENKSVYHITCDGEPIDTFHSEEEAQEHLDLLKKDHPGKQFIIEKTAYESKEDMIHKLDEMGEQLEEKENSDMKETFSSPCHPNVVFVYDLYEDLKENDI